MTHWQLRGLLKDKGKYVPFPAPNIPDRRPIPDASTWYSGKRLDWAVEVFSSLLYKLIQLNNYFPKLMDVSAIY